MVPTMGAALETENMNKTQAKAQAEILAVTILHLKACETWNKTQRTDRSELCIMPESKMNTSIWCGKP